MEEIYQPFGKHIRAEIGPCGDQSGARVQVVDAEEPPCGETECWRHVMTFAVCRQSETHTPDRLETATER